MDIKDPLGAHCISGGDDKTFLGERCSPGWRDKVIGSRGGVGQLIRLLVAALLSPALYGSGLRKLGRHRPPRGDNDYLHSESMSGAFLRRGGRRGKPRASATT